MRAKLALSLFLFASGFGTLAFGAGEQDARCIEGYEGSQEAERAQNLRKARELALICSVEACHDSIEKSCREWVKALDEKIPSVKVIVKDPSGKILVSPKVSIDDEMSISGSGREVALDPGTHSVTVSHPGYSEATVSFELELGRKAAPVEIVLRSLATEKPSEKEASAPSERSSARPPLWPAFALGGVSVAGFATLAIFGSSARSADSALDSGPDACAVTKTCSPERIDSIQMNYTIANVGLAVGSVFLASAVGYTVWTLTSSSGDESGKLSLVPSGVRFEGNF